MTCVASTHFAWPERKGCTVYTEPIQLLRTIKLDFIRLVHRRARQVYFFKVSTMPCHGYIVPKTKCLSFVRNATVLQWNRRCSNIQCLNLFSCCMKICVDLNHRKLNHYKQIAHHITCGFHFCSPLLVSFYDWIKQKLSATHVIHNDVPVPKSSGECQCFYQLFDLFKFFVVFITFDLIEVFKVQDVT